MFNRDVLDRLEVVLYSIDLINRRLDHHHAMLHEIATAVKVNPETLRQLTDKLKRSQEALTNAINANQPKET